jgi:DNA-binding NarL/FixJ family response regulator
MKTSATVPGPLRASRLVVAGQELLVFREPLAQPERAEHGLSASEEEVIALLLEGLSLDEVARRRATEVRAVVREVDTACKKLGVPSGSKRARSAGTRRSRRVAL